MAATEIDAELILTDMETPGALCCITLNRTCELQLVIVIRTRFEGVHTKLTALALVPSGSHAVFEVPIQRFAD